MDKSFKPRSGRFGIMVVNTSKEFGTNPFTANSTVTHSAPSPGGKCYPLRAYVSCTIAASDADGTCLIRLIRRRASDDSDIQLTTDYDVEGLTIKERTELTFDSTKTDSQRIFLEADRLEFDLVSNSAGINTQPTDLTVTVEWAVLQ